MKDLFLRSWFFIVIAILLIVLVVYAIWSTEKKKAEIVEMSTEQEEVVEEIEEEVLPEIVEEATELMEAEEATEAGEATDSAQVDEGDEEAIKLAVLESIGLEEEEVAFTITIYTGAHAKGNVREVDAVGGGYWLAAKDENGDWVAVYNGQANPPCGDVDAYNFRTSMVPECMDASNNAVTR